MRRGRVAGLVAGVALVALTAKPPTLDLRMLSHDRAGAAPATMRAAIDLGIVAVSLVWSRMVDDLR